MAKKAKMSNKKKDIVFGHVELDADEFDPKYSKVRITTFIDLDILEALKAIAKKQGRGYQTLLNETLRKVVLGEKASVENELLEKLISRIERLEDRVG